MRVVDLDRDMSDVIPTGGSADSVHLFERMTERTLLAAAADAGSRVLDAAGGLGQDSRALAERGVRAVCVEPSRRMSALGRQLGADGPAGVTWARAWCESLPFADDSFDAAVCKGALDHFDDPLACIAELARVTRPGGRVVLAVANFESLACRLGRRFAAPARGRAGHHVPSDHFTRYDPDLLRAQLSRHLDLQHWEGVSLLWGVRGWTRLLQRLGPRSRRAWLRAADAVARRAPALADVIVAAGTPR